MEASWSAAEEALMRLGVTDAAGLWVSVSSTRFSRYSKTDTGRFRRRNS